MPSSIKLTEPLDILVEYGYLDEDKPYHKALNNAVMDFAENPDLGGEYNKEYVMLLQNEAKKELKLRRKKINVSKFFGKDQTTEAPAKDTKGTSSLAVRSKTGNIDTKKLIPQSSDEKKEGALAEILTGVNSIVDTLKGQQKQDKKHQSWLQKLQETFKRRKKENKLEFKVLDGIKNTATKLLAPFESAWTKVFNFIKDVFLGRILFKILEWMGNPDNQDKIKSITRFFQDWWPVMLGAYLIFGNALTGFALGLLKSVVVWGAKLASVVIPALLKAAVMMGPWGLAAVAVLGGAAYLATKKNKTDQKVDQSVQEQGRDETVDQLKEEKESKNMMERVGGFFTGEGQEREEQIQRVETGTEKRYGFFGELDRPAETQNFKEGGLVQHYNNATQEASNIIQGFNEGGYSQQVQQVQQEQDPTQFGLPADFDYDKPEHRELLVDVISPHMKNFVEQQNAAVDEDPSAFNGIKLEMDRDGRMPNFGKFIANMSETAFNNSVAMIQSNDSMQDIPEAQGAIINFMTDIRRQTLDNPNFKGDIAFDINKDIPGTAAYRLLMAAQQDTTSPAAKSGAFTPEQLARQKNRMNMVSGGVVKGPGGVDKVPARLTAGEFVMSKGAVEKYGANTLAAMNAAGGGTNIPTLMGGKPGYAGGGRVLSTSENATLQQGQVVSGNMNQSNAEKMQQRLNLEKAKSQAISTYGYKSPEANEIRKKLLILQGIPEKAIHTDRKGNLKIKGFSGGYGKTTTSDGNRGGGLFGGLKRVVGGTADQLTGNLFDFDKRSGGGLTRKTAGALARPMGGLADIATGNLFDFDNKSGGGLIRKTANAVGGLFGGGGDRVKPQRGGGQGNKIRAVKSKSNQPNIGPSDKKKVTVAYEEERNKMENKNKAAKPDQKIPEFDVFGGRSSAKMKVLGIMV